MAINNDLQMDLKIPKNYDFSTRNMDWKKFKPYYILRTDAVWEKSKLYSYFYSLYKGPLYFNNDKFYLLNSVWMYVNVLHKRTDVTYDEIGSSGENHKEAGLYNPDVMGGIFSNDLATTKNTPRKTTQFVGDWSKDTTFLCMIKFFKWMRCNEKSDYKLSSNALKEENFMKYDCYEELRELDEHCIAYHFKVMFEMYYLRIMTDFVKYPSSQRITRLQDQSRRPTNSRNLYY